MLFRSARVLKTYIMRDLAPIGPESVSVRAIPVLRAPPVITTPKLRLLNPATIGTTTETARLSFGLRPEMKAAKPSFGEG